MIEKFGYNGIVKLSYERNGERFGITTHNGGTDFLFQFLAKALCWDNVYDYRPRYIDLGYYTDIDSKKVFTSIINSNARIQIKPLLSTYQTSPAAYIVGSIPYESLSTKPDGIESTDWAVRILSNYRASVDSEYVVMAEAKLGGKPSISSGTQLIAEWWMYVTDANSENGGNS